MTNYVTGLCQELLTNGYDQEQATAVVEHYLHSRTWERPKLIKQLHSALLLPQLRADFDKIEPAEVLKLVLAIEPNKARKVLKVLYK